MSSQGNATDSTPTPAHNGANENQGNGFTPTKTISRSPPGFVPTEMHIQKSTNLRSFENSSGLGPAAVDLLGGGSGSLGRRKSSSPVNSKKSQSKKSQNVSPKSSNTVSKKGQDNTPLAKVGMYWDEADDETSYNTKRGNNSGRKSSGKGNNKGNSNRASASGKGSKNREPDQVGSIKQGDFTPGNRVAEMGQVTGYMSRFMRAGSESSSTGLPSGYANPQVDNYVPQSEAAAANSTTNQYPDSSGSNRKSGNSVGSKGGASSVGSKNTASSLSPIKFNPNTGPRGSAASRGTKNFVFSVFPIFSVSYSIC